MVVLLREVTPPRNAAWLVAVRCYIDEPTAPTAGDLARQGHSDAAAVRPAMFAPEVYTRSGNEYQGQGLVAAVRPVLDGVRPRHLMWSTRRETSARTILRTFSA